MIAFLLWSIPFFILAVVVFFLGQMESITSSGCRSCDMASSNCNPDVVGAAYWRQATARRNHRGSRAPGQDRLEGLRNSQVSQMARSPLCGLLALAAALRCGRCSCRYPSSVCERRSATRKRASPASVTSQNRQCVARHSRKTGVTAQNRQQNRGQITISANIRKRSHNTTRGRCVHSGRMRPWPATSLYPAGRSAACHSARQQSRTVLLRRGRLPALSGRFTGGASSQHLPAAYLRADDQLCASAVDTDVGIRRLASDAGRGTQARALYQSHVLRRSGTLWEGRYKASLIDSEAYLLACMRDIELNPLRAPRGWRTRGGIADQAMPPTPMVGATRA